MITFLDLLSQNSNIFFSSNKYYFFPLIYDVSSVFNRQLASSYEELCIALGLWGITVWFGFGFSFVFSSDNQLMKS